MAIEPLQDEPTIGRLVSDASRDISSLLQKEIQLAKSELKVSFKNGGTGVGLFAGALFFLVMGLIMFSVGLAYLLNWNGEGLDLHWAFMVVFVFYLLVAGLLGFIGYRKVRKVRGPEKAIAEAQKTKAALTNRDSPRGELAQGGTSLEV
jgi:membrane protein implicated in regulation of membrane protease activity